MEPTDDETRFIERALLALDGHLGPEDQAALDAQMAGDVGKRRLFVRLCLESRALSEMLRVNGEPAAPDDGSPPEETGPRGGSGKEGSESIGEVGHRFPTVGGPLRRRLKGLPWKIAAAACIAALLAGGFAVQRWWGVAPHRSRSATVAGEGYAGGKDENEIASLLEARDVVWAEGQSPIAIGTRVAPRDIRCASGTLTLAFDAGARVTLEGSIDLRILSGTRLRANRGRVIAHVEDKAKGFTIETPNTLVVDRGTEFGVEVDALGQTGVVVFKGLVDLSRPNSADGQAPVQRLRGGEALRVGRAGVLSRIVAVDRRLGSDAWSTGPSTDPDAVFRSVRDNIRGLGSTKYYQVVRRGLDEDAPAYVDRLHQWNGLGVSGLPPLLRGADYIMPFNDDKKSTDLEITVELARAATLYIFYDDRDPPPPWLVEGFTDTGLDIGLDEHRGRISGLARGPGRGIDTGFSIWKREVGRGESVQLGALRQRPPREGSGLGNRSHDSSDDLPPEAIPLAMYGIAAVARP